MARYRLLGYYDDNGQVYDGGWEGGTEVEAVQACYNTLNDVDRDQLVLVAILNEDGANVYDSDTASFVKEWPLEDE